MSDKVDKPEGSTSVETSATKPTISEELKAELEELRAFKAKVEAEQKAVELAKKQAAKETLPISDTFFSKKEETVPQKKSNYERNWEDMISNGIPYREE